MDNGHVKFKVASEAVIGAKGVFTSIENEDTKVPTESSLRSSVQAVREAFVGRRIKTLYWCDTRGMVSDGLTKEVWTDLKPSGDTKKTCGNHVVTSLCPSHCVWSGLSSSNRLHRQLGTRTIVVFIRSGSFSIGM